MRRQVSAQLGWQGIFNVSWALAVLRIGPPREVAEILMIEAQVYGSEGGVDACGQKWERVLLQVEAEMIMIEARLCTVAVELKQLAILHGTCNQECPCTVCLTW